MSVAIIGCGWLGQALAKQLKTENIELVASYQSKETQNKLAYLGLETIKLSLPFENGNDIQQPLLIKDTWLIAIPPKLRYGQLDYPDKIKQLVDYAKIHRVKKLIIISSTAALNGLTGEVDEDAHLDLTAPKVAVLSKAEQLVLNTATPDMQTAVIRMAGLIGKDRHPGRFLSANKEYQDGSATINLIHQKDAVGLLVALIKAKSVQGIYHGVSPNKVDKKRYYQLAANSLGLIEPTFAETVDKTLSKSVLGNKTARALAYHYQIPSVVEWLKVSS